MIAIGRNQLLLAENVSSSTNIFLKVSCHPWMHLECAVINKPDAIQETVTWESDTRRQETNKKGHLKKKIEEDNHQQPINR